MRCSESRVKYHMKLVLGINRTMSDTCLPGHPTPFRLLFGGDAQTQLNAVQPEIDGNECRGECILATQPTSVLRRYEPPYGNDTRTSKGLGTIKTTESVVPP